MSVFNGKLLYFAIAAFGVLWLVYSILSSQMPLGLDPWCNEVSLISQELPTGPIDSLSLEQRASAIAQRFHEVWRRAEGRCKALVEEVRSRLEAVIPTIYAITSTYPRSTQKADLTRLMQTLQQVPNLFWVLVEDAPSNTELVTLFLQGCPVPHVHLSITKSADHDAKPKAAPQRDLALAWVRKRIAASDKPSVIYIADDDNTYSIQLFEELRYIRKIGILPVGIVGMLPYESPVISEGRVRDWFSGYQRKRRKFPIDMAGFAVNGKLLLAKPDAKFESHNAVGGVMETQFIEALGVTQDDLEPRANNCTKILVWHTQTKDYHLQLPKTVGDVVQEIEKNLNITYNVITDV